MQTDQMNRIRRYGMTFPLAMRARNTHARYLTDNWSANMSVMPLLRFITRNSSP